MFTTAIIYVFSPLLFVWMGREKKMEKRKNERKENEEKNVFFLLLLDWEEKRGKRKYKYMQTAFMSLHFIIK